MVGLGRFGWILNTAFISSKRALRQATRSGPNADEDLEVAAREFQLRRTAGHQHKTAIPDRLELGSRHQFGFWE